MDIKKAKKFLLALEALEKKHGFKVSQSNQQELVYDEEDNVFLHRAASYLSIVDEEGNEIPVNEVKFQMEKEVMK